MSEDMAAKIIEFIKDEYVDDEDQEISASTQLISSGLVDSFSLVSLKMFLEEEYGVSIPDAEVTAEAFDSVASIMELVKSKQG